VDKYLEAAKHRRMFTGNARQVILQNPRHQAEQAEQQPQVEQQAQVIEHLHLQQEELESYQPVKFHQLAPLPCKEVIKIFSAKTGLVKKLPLKPESGTVWRFCNGGDNKDLWRAQLYQWAEPGGPKYIMNGEVVKRTFAIRTEETNNKRGDKRFQMFVWSMPRQHPEVILLHFLGDATLSAGLKHGNAKRTNARPYHSTLPATMREMRQTNLAPAAFYRKKRAEAEPDLRSQVFEVPRDTKQVRNTQSNARMRNGLTDTLSMLNIYANDTADCKYEQFS